MFEKTITSSKGKGKDNKTQKDTEERKKLDEKWLKLLAEVKKNHPDFEEPDGKVWIYCSTVYYRTFSLYL